MYNLPMKHLAIFSKEAANRIFEGKKTIESRFSLNNIAPFSKVHPEDIIYIKIAGGDIEGQFRAAKVIFFEGLDSKQWNFIRSSFGGEISLGSKALDDEFFKSHKNARFATLIFITRVEKFLAPPIEIKKRDKRGWVVL